MAAVSVSYNARAATYDDKTTFHRRLASEYISYAKPQPGESLLDLACGTGLVTFEFANILQSSPSSSSLQRRPKVVGVDISPGMLSVACSKLSDPANQDLSISFLEHDITSLTFVPELHGYKVHSISSPSAPRLYSWRILHQ